MAKAKKKAAAKKVQKKVTKPAKKAKVAAKAKPAAKAKGKLAAPKKAAVKKPAAKAAKAAVKTRPAVKPLKAAAKPVAKPAARTQDLAQHFTPLDNRILVEKTGAAQRTPGGLYIPDTVSSEDRPTQGKVVAVGRGHLDKKGRLQPLDVKVGDTVMFNSFTGSDVRINNNDFLCLREEEILAIVKE